MNKYKIYALKIARKAYTSTFNSKALFGLTSEYVDYSGAPANALIKDMLLSDKPVMIARFGATEMNCLANYIGVKQHKNNLLGYIQGKIHHFWWDDNTLLTMSEQSGFYPSNPYMLENFSTLMLDDMKLVDVLGSWLKKEIIFNNELSSAVRVDFQDLEPYRHDDPWTSALAGKKVLVVHPFEESIKSQYKKRKLLFEDENVLPEFDLKTIKAVQSIGNNQNNFKTWFEALDYMKERISDTDFDIAIIGCGAYGFPLAAHVKRIGKKAVHLGGATQILFGITGKRWEREKQYEFILKMMNQNWIRPLSSETPQGAEKLENSAYW